MGICYYTTLKEKEEKIKELEKKGFKIFHTEFIDEQGNSTSGSSGQLVFATKEQQEKSIESRFVKPIHYFYSEVESIKTLTEMYPLMYDEYENFLFNKFPEQLGFDMMRKRTPEQLLSLYHFKQSLARKNLPKEKWNLIQQDDRDKALLVLSKNKMFLSNSENFVRNMSLIYLVTLFYGYFTTIIYEVFWHNQNLIELIPKDREIRKINDKNSEQFKQELIDFVDKDFTGQGIQNTAYMLKKYFEFEIKRDNFETLDEILERRNMLVHHEGKPNKRYRKKFPQNAKLAKLDVSQDYLLGGIKLFETYVSRINGFFWTQYGKPIYLKQMQS